MRSAAIAALFTLTVVEPMMVGILGGGMAHIRLADGTHTVIDGQSTAPGATHATVFTPDPDAPPRLALGGRTRVLAWAHGTQGLAQQMQQQRQQGGDGEVGDNPGNDPSQNAQGNGETDPLGRSLPSSRTNDRTRLYEDGRKTPTEERARALLEELRRRLGEVARPQAEIDYLLRLLQSETLMPKP